VNKLKQYITNAALIAGGTMTTVLAITALDLIGETAGRIAVAIMALGFMALLSKMPNPGNGKHRELNKVTLNRAGRN
tara:strand:+ start:107 stop:337 length:231 start_codon:yes stop_codon:yes gene_type:complete